MTVPTKVVGFDTEHAQSFLPKVELRVVYQDDPPDRVVEASAALHVHLDTTGHVASFHAGPGANGLEAEHVHVVDDTLFVEAPFQRIGTPAEDASGVGGLGMPLASLARSFREGNSQLSQEQERLARMELFQSSPAIAGRTFSSIPQLATFAHSPTLFPTSSDSEDIPVSPLALRALPHARTEGRIHDLFQGILSGNSDGEELAALDLASPRSCGDVAETSRPGSSQSGHSGGSQIRRSVSSTGIQRKPCDLWRDMLDSTLEPAPGSALRDDEGDEGNVQGALVIPRRGRPAKRLSITRGNSPHRSPQILSPYKNISRKGTPHTSPGASPRFSATRTLDFGIALSAAATTSTAGAATTTTTASFTALPSDAHGMARGIAVDVSLRDPTKPTVKLKSPTARVRNMSY